MREVSTVPRRGRPFAWRVRTSAPADGERGGSTESSFTFIHYQSQTPNFITPVCGLVCDCVGQLQNSKPQERKYGRTNVKNGNSFFGVLLLVSSPIPVELGDSDCSDCSELDLDCSDWLELQKLTFEPNYCNSRVWKRQSKQSESTGIWFYKYFFACFFSPNFQSPKWAINNLRKNLRGCWGGGPGDHIMLGFSPQILKCFSGPPTGLT